MKTSKVALYKGNKFLLTNTYLYVAQALDHVSQETKLHVSFSNFSSYEFKEIDFNVKEHSYHLLDMTENSVFIHVNHFGEKSPYGQIFVSDKDGVKFSSSLEYNVQTEDGDIEFEKVILLITF